MLANVGKCRQCCQNCQYLPEQCCQISEFAQASNVSVRFCSRAAASPTLHLRTRGTAEIGAQLLRVRLTRPCPDRFRLPSSAIKARPYDQKEHLGGPLFEKDSPKRCVETSAELSTEVSECVRIWLSWHQ